MAPSVPVATSSQLAMLQAKRNKPWAALPCRKGFSIVYGITRNLTLLRSLPLEVVTVTNPEVAPGGTRVVR
jgi:hypothetical protein